MSRYSKNTGFGTFLGLFLIFFALVTLALPNLWVFDHINTLPVSSWWSTFLGWQAIYFALGVGMALLVNARADRSLYLFMFLVFLAIVIFCNFNHYYGWSVAWADIWQRIAGLFCILLGFFFILCARYYTVKITVRPTNAI